MSGKLTTLTSTIHNNPGGISLIEYLCERFQYKNKTAWLDAIAAGQVVVNGQNTIPSHILKYKDQVSYTSLRTEPPVNTDIATIFEDDHLLIVNKPAPLSVHSNGIFISNTLINLLRQKHNNEDLSLCHRLDRETTGVLVLAKDRKLTAQVMAKFEESTVEKKYLAVTRGEINFQEKMIRGWMGPKPNSLIQIRQELIQEFKEGYKESSTRFTLSKKLKDHSLVECELLSGRSNQIRLHLEAAGYPIVGDKLYGREDEQFLNYLDNFKKYGDLTGGDQYDHPRHLLHAWKLSLNHPVTEQRMHWEAPIHADMAKFISDRSL